MTTPYKLYYWPGIQGRGEFIRLALEDAGAPYVDVARLPEAKGGGVKAIFALLRGERGVVPFAPPILDDNGVMIWQTANILAHVAPKHGLVPKDEENRAHALGYQLTITDFIAEAHDTHHPIDTSLYYEDQKPEAEKRAAAFLKNRLTKFLGYFEASLERGGGHHFIGRASTYVDLSMFQVIVGLQYAFPKAMKRMAKKIPRLSALRDSVAARPNIAAYLASDRRIPFNEEGVFRHYPELDS